MLPNQEVKDDNQTKLKSTSDANQDESTINYKISQKLRKKFSRKDVNDEMKLYFAICLEVIKNLKS